MKQFFTLAFLLLAITLSAQKAKLAKANEAFDQQNFDAAIPLYLEFLDKKDIHQAKKNLAECYRRVENWTEAEYWFGQIVNLPDAKPIYFLYYGQALQANGKCDLASEYYQEYSRLVPDDFRGQLLAQACYQERNSPIIPICKDCYEIQSVSFNSPFDDYSPTIHKNQLVFASEHNIFENRRVCFDIGFPKTYLLTTSIDTSDYVNHEYLYDSLSSLFFPKTMDLVGASTFLNDNEIYCTQTFITKYELLYFKIIEDNR